MVTAEEYLKIAREQRHGWTLPIEEWWECEWVDTIGMAADLALDGVMLWDEPLWWADIGSYCFPFKHWPHDLEKAQRVAQALVQHCPEDPLDPDIIAKLRYLADGEFCVVFEGETCPYLTPEEAALLPHRKV